MAKRAEQGQEVPMGVERGEHEAETAFRSLLDAESGVASDDSEEQDEEHLEDGDQSLEGEDEGQEELDDEEDFDDEFDDEDEDEEDGSAELHTVRVNGEELKVPYDELVAGYSRQADYTRKTQEVAQAREAVQSEWEQARQERQQAAALLNQYNQRLQRMQPAEPDWERLSQEDPIEFVRQKEAWRDRKEHIAQVQRQIQELQAREERAQQEQLRETLQVEHGKLMEAIPGWSEDPEKAQKERQEMVNYALEHYPVSREELQQIHSHVPLVLLWKAWKYDRANSQARNLKPSRKAGQPRPATPGSQPGTTGPRGRKGKLNKRLKRGAQQLEKTGSDDAAVDVFKTLLATER